MFVFYIYSKVKAYKSGQSTRLYLPIAMTSRDTRWMTFVNPGFSSNQGDEGDRDAVIDDEPTEVHYGYEDSEVAFDHDLEEDHTFYRPVIILTRYVL